MNKDTHFLKKSVSLLKVFTLSLRQKKEIYLNLRINCKNTRVFITLKTLVQIK